MKKKIFGLVFACLLLTGCQKTPELIEPVGAVPNSAIVERGEIYNITHYDSAVVESVKEIKTSSDCIVKSVDVSLGSEVKQGDVLLTLDGDAMSDASASLDEQIAQFKQEADYANRLLEADIALYEAAVQKAESGGDADEISKARERLTDVQNELNANKVEQSQQLANMEAMRMAGGVSGGTIVAPCDGTVCYLNAVAIGSALKSNTMIVAIAEKDSFMLKGTVIPEDEQNNAHELYALIGGNKYAITNKAYSAAEVSFLVSNNYPLYSHFYFEADENVSVGMYAAIVRIWDYKENVLIIPDNALYSDEKGYYVYVMKEDKKERRDITVGVISDVAAEVTEGLEEGEEVYVK